MRTIVLSLLAMSAAGLVLAQSSNTVIVVPASPSNAPAKVAVANDNSSALEGALQMLRQMKAINEETLRKQAATLQQLDEMEQAADQLKIYAKRG